MTLTTFNLTKDGDALSEVGLKPQPTASTLILSSFRSIQYIGYTEHIISNFEIHGHSLESRHWRSHTF